jgi:hypothetical protein
MQSSTDKPNGPVAAALLAGGIGSAVLGLLTLFNQLYPARAYSQFLVWYKPVGALSGKSSLAILAFLLAWLVLGLLWRRREVNFKAVSMAAFVCLAVGLLGTFPPFWHLFLPPIPQS